MLTSKPEQKSESRMGRRWLLESWDTKRGRWIEEACWHDGENANGTPRRDRAFIEARALVDAGIAARVFDLYDQTAHSVITFRGIE